MTYLKPIFGTYHRLMIRYIILAFTLFFCNHSYGQNQSPLSQLHLMNGKVMTVQLTDTSGANIFFDVKLPNGKIKSKSLYTDQVFSIVSSDGIEKVLYRYEEIIGNDFTVDEMRYYIYGESDALNGYNGKPTFWAGMALGAGGSYALGGGFIPFTIPLAYTGGMQIPFIKIRAKTITDQEYTYHPTYALGYEKSARTRKTMNALIGSLIGVAIGGTLYELTNP